jgi:pimeloyl-ACP methyl ester carboxylesterase
MSEEQPFNYRPVNTECAWLKHPDGSRILTVVNTPVGKSHGAVLFIPAFGMSAHTLLIPAFSVASTGFSTMRFDARNNSGGSQGDILDYKPSLLLEDARLAADKLVKRFGTDDFVIVSMSLAAPVALMLAREYPRARLVMFVPTPDLCATIETASETPGCMAAYREGNRDAPEVVRVLGHDVRLRQVFEDVRDMGLDTIEAVLAIARSVRGRADLVMAEQDALSTPEANVALVEALDAAAQTVVLQRVGHNFGRSPLALRAAFDHLVKVTQAHFGVPEERRAGGVPPGPMIAAAGKKDSDSIESLLGASRPQTGNGGTAAGTEPGRA